MTTAPERIWADANRQWSSVGWSQSNEFVGDVEYVRADIASTLTAERERLALAICGGEDAPGYANAQTIETLERVAKQNRQSHDATINSLLAAEAERDRLREALNQSRLAFAGYVSVQSAIDLIDRAALKGEQYE